MKPNRASMRHNTAMMILSEMSRQLTELVQKAGELTVAVDARRRLTSSGILWGGDLVVTAAHAIKRDQGLTVFLPDGRELPANLAARDPGRDLALLKVEGLEQAPPSLAEPPVVGQLVLAVARSPVDGLGCSLGILSERGGPWRTYAGSRLEQHLQPDLRLYPGYSGGPLVDTEGRLIGLNTDALTRVGVVTVAASTIGEFVESWQKGARISRAYLGLAMHSVRLPEKLQAPGGALVLHVEPEGPGDQAGLLPGDILISLGGQATPGLEELLASLGDVSPGESIRLTILRGGEPREVTLEAGLRPGPVEVREVDQDSGC
ncbi:serine protease [bacterium CPR1]|nr:serine protease [bacterium CPR1]